MGIKQSNLYILMILLSSLVVASYQACAPFAPTNDESQSLPSSTGSSYVDTSMVCEPDEPMSVSHMRRLSKVELNNTLIDLLDRYHSRNVEDAIDFLEDDAIQAHVKEFTNLVDSQQMAAYERIAANTFFRMMQEPYILYQRIESCMDDSPSPECVEKFIRNSGLKAFRRPLTEDEVTKFKEIFSMGETGIEGGAYVFYALLISPKFLLHWETGQTPEGRIDPDGAFDLTSYEIASRLSYALWDAPPDEELYQAAANGQLNTKEQIAKQVDRMIDDPRTKDVLGNFFEYYVDPKSYTESVYSREFVGEDLRYKQSLENANSELEREMFEFIDHIVWESRSGIKELLTSRKSFVRETKYYKTTEAAKIYGHEPIPRDVDNPEPKTMHSQRMGLFMRAPVIANESDDTRPILRGTRFSGRFLCNEVGIPSGVLVTTGEFGSLEAKKMHSTRERTVGMTSDSSCMSCHESINAMGFPLEQFDSIGRLREVERVFDSDGNLVAQHPIDTRSSIPRLDGQPTQVETGVDFIQRIAESTEVRSCFTRHLWRHYTLTKEENGDGCTLAPMVEHLQSSKGNGSIVGVLKQMLVNDAIKRRRIQ